MEIRIIALINLLAYGFIVSQALFYILAFARMQRNITASAYIEVRHLLDSNMQGRLRILHCITTVTSLVLILLTSGNPLGLLFITSSIAFVALIIELILDFKREIPIYKIIKRASGNNYAEHWKKYSRKWFHINYIRQGAAIVGFVSLLIGITCGV